MWAGQAAVALLAAWLAVVGAGVNESLTELDELKDMGLLTDGADPLPGMPLQPSTNSACAPPPQMSSWKPAASW